MRYWLAGLYQVCFPSGYKFHFGACGTFRDFDFDGEDAIRFIGKNEL